MQSQKRKKMAWICEYRSVGLQIRIRTPCTVLSCLYTSSESHSVECRFMGALCVDLATTPGSVPGHDPLRLSCDSGKSTKGIREPHAMWLDSLAGWSSAQRARSPSAALRCRSRGSSRLGDFKSFSALFRRGEGAGGGKPPNPLLA